MAAPSADTESTSTADSAAPEDSSETAVDTQPADTAETDVAPAETGETDATTATTQPETAGSVEAEAGTETTSTVEGPGVAAPEEPPVEEPPAEEPVAEPEKKLPTFTPGVHAFLRGEGRINPDFAADAGAENQAAVLERVRLQLLANWGPVSGFVQFQDARSWGFEGSTVSNEANTDLHQGWMELGGKKNDLSGFIRLGRQQINIGNQRLIGALGWAATARSFDTIMLHGQAGRFKLDLFGAMLQMPGQVSAPDPMDPMAPDLTANTAGNQLVGLVFGADIHDAIKAELVGLYERADARNGALGFERNIANTGLRLFGEPVKGLKYDAEGNVQFGNNQTRKHFAWAWAARVDYVYGKPKVKPGVHVGYAMASGEACTGDPSAGEACGNAQSREFFNFYPTNHMHYGFVDLLGWRNMRELEAGVMIAIPAVLKKLEVKYHFQQLNDPTGRWSNAGGASVGAGWDPTNTARTLGHQIDLYAVIKPWEVLFIQPGYGVFLPAGAGESLGGTDPQHFLWLWMMVTF